MCCIYERRVGNGDVVHQVVAVVEPSGDGGQILQTDGRVLRRFLETFATTSYERSHQAWRLRIVINAPQVHSRRPMADCLAGDPPFPTCVGKRVLLWRLQRIHAAPGTLTVEGLSSRLQSLTYDGVAS